MLRLLVIDDSFTSRAIASRLVGDLYEIRTASSGTEGLALAREGGFDLILLDLLMPGMDGQAVLAELRSGGIGIPAVVMTADIQDSTRARVLQLGARGMVNKPLTREKIIAAVEATLGGGAGRPG